MFILRKRGECEPLVWLESASVFVPKDGTPFGISLRHRTAKLPSSSVKPDIVVEVWNDYANHDESLRHDWRCRIRVPGGGLVEREGQFDFEAPADGYREEIAVSKPRTMERWNAQFRDEFFVELHDGCYARIEIQVSAALDNYVLIKSHLNPVPGHRNLEFDPAKAIKPAP